jgi:hypothetical protein
MNATDTVTLVVGAFYSDLETDQVLNELGRAGFRDDQIAVIGKKKSLKEEVLAILVGLGLSRHEATHYQHAHESGRTLVVVEAEGRYRAAQLILDRNGYITPYAEANLPDAGPVLVGMPLLRYRLSSPLTDDIDAKKIRADQRRGVHGAKGRDPKAKAVNA